MEKGCILSGIDDNIDENSLIDCHRPGKFYEQNMNTRPILAKLVKPIDVLCILSKHDRLRGNISIRADLIKQERENEKLLLKERWALIKSGVPRSDIKIRN